MNQLHTGIEQLIGYETDLRGMSKQTKENYLYQIRKFVEFSKKHPRRISIIDAKRYLSHLKTECMSPNTISQALSAIKFLYSDIWQRQTFSQLKAPQASPTYRLTRQDVSRMVRKTPLTKHKILIELLSLSGLPLSQIIRLTTKDIHLNDRILNIPNTETKRIVLLEEYFIEMYVHYLTERYYNKITSVYLFDHGNTHLSAAQALDILTHAAIKAGIDQEIEI